MKFWSIKILELLIKIDRKVPSKSQVRRLQLKWRFLALQSFLLSRHGAGACSSAVISPWYVLFLSIFLQHDFRMNTNLWLFIQKNFLQVLEVGLVVSKQVHKPRVGCLGVRGSWAWELVHGDAPHFLFPPGRTGWGPGGGATAHMPPVRSYSPPNKPYKCEPKAYSFSETLCE